MDETETENMNEEPKLEFNEQEHKQRMLSFMLAQTRRKAMEQILDDLMDGHSNPEGFLEWLDQKSDEEFVQWWKEVNSNAG